MTHCCQCIVFLRHKGFDLLLSGCDQCQCRCLNAATGKLCIVTTCQCPCSIHSHQPVCFRPGLCCRIQIQISPAILQILKAFTNRFIRYRRNPKTLDRLLIAGNLQNPSGYQLTFPAGICCNDNCPHVFAQQLILHNLKLSVCLLNHNKLKMLWHHRKIFDPP